MKLLELSKHIGGLRLRDSLYIYICYWPNHLCLLRLRYSIYACMDNLTGHMDEIWEKILYICMLLVRSFMHVLDKPLCLSLKRLSSLSIVDRVFLVSMKEYIIKLVISRAAFNWLSHSHNMSSEICGQHAWSPTRVLNFFFPVNVTCVLIYSIWNHFIHHSFTGRNWC